MSTFVMQHCTIRASGRTVELLALVPAKYVELSAIIEELESCPFAEVFPPEFFLDVSTAELRKLRNKFPKLACATMLFNALTISYPLDRLEAPKPVTEDRYLSPFEDVILLAPVGSLSLLQ